ncbi:unnamed protein product, partial [Oppiella nova]
CQQKLYEEVNGLDGKYDYESVSKMPYLEACIAETLRLYNPIPIINRHASQEYTLGDTGLTIPKGMNVFFDAYTIHHSPEYYPNPERWDPERFMPENRDQLTPYTYMPFGTGPRNCVGMRFALMEAKAAIAQLVHKYKFKTTSNTTVPLKLKNYLTRNFKYWSSRGINGPTPVPILGTIWQVFTKPMPELSLDNYRKYGKLYGTFMGTKPALRISDPEIIKTMNTKDFHVFMNRFDFSFGDQFQDKSLFILMGDEWKTMRSIISPTFSCGKMRSMHPIIIDCVHRLDNYLETKAMTGEDVEMKKTMGSLTMDVIASCAFGTKIDVYNDHKTSEFIVNANKVYRGGSRWRILVFIILVSISPKLLKWTGFQFLDPSVENFFTSALTELCIQSLSRCFSNRSRVLTADNETEGDDLNEDIYGKTESTETSNKSKNTLLTDIDILANSFLFFLNGYETTGALLSYLFYSLALNEKCQQKLYEEVNGLDGKYDYESVSKMPYLEACIAETLRLYNPVPAINRIASEDYTIGNTGLTIPKGMTVSFDIHALHHSPEYYPNPERWDPERFMPENRDQLTPYTYMPFGTGPRNC